MTEQTGTVRFNTRGIAADPVAVAPTWPSVRERRAAGSAALASVIVVAVNVVPFAARKFPGITARYTEWSASSIAAPWPSQGSGMLMASPLAMLALVLACAILGCLLFNRRLPTLVWGGLTAALALTMVLPVWRILDVIAAHQWILLGPGLLCAIVMLAALNAARHSRTARTGSGSLMKAVAAGVLVGLATLPIAASSVVEQLSAAAGPATSIELSLGSAALAHQRDQDAAAAMAFKGRWVAQLGSARIAQDPANIDVLAAIYLDSHRQISGLGEMVLLRGDDLTGKASDVPTWLTVNERSFPSARQVSLWCKEQALGRDRCLPRTAKRK